MKTKPTSSCIGVYITRSKSTKIIFICCNFGLHETLSSSARSYRKKKPRAMLAAKAIKTAPKNHASTARNLGLKVSEF